MRHLRHRPAGHPPRFVWGALPVGRVSILAGSVANSWRNQVLTIGPRGHDVAMSSAGDSGIQDQADRDAAIVTERQLVTYLARKSIAARAQVSIRTAINEGVTDANVIKERVRKDVLTQTQRRGAAINRNIDEQIARAIDARDWEERHGKSLPSFSGGAWSEVVTEGIVGNGTYDLILFATAYSIKSLVSRKRRGARPQAASNSREILNAYVILAVQDQSRRHDLVIPKVEEFKTIKWEYGHSSSTAYLSLKTKPHFSATVEVPNQNLARSGARVTIYNHEPTVVNKQLGHGTTWIN
jgi:hypothetical protein